MKAMNADATKSSAEGAICRKRVANQPKLNFKRRAIKARGAGVNVTSGQSSENIVIVGGNEDYHEVQCPEPN